MKKILCLILSVLLVSLCLVSCFEGVGTTKPKDDTTTKSPEQVEQEKAQINTVLTNAKTKMEGKGTSLSATFEVKDGTETKKYQIESMKSGEDFMFAINEVANTDPYKANIYVVGNMAYVSTPIASIRTPIDREELEELSTSFDTFLTKASAYLKAYVDATASEEGKTENNALKLDFEALIEATKTFDINYMVSPSVKVENGVTTASFELSEEFMKKLDKIDGALDTSVNTPATTFPKVEFEITIDENGYVSSAKITNDDAQNGFILDISVDAVGDDIVISAPSNVNAYKDVSLGESARQSIYDNIKKTFDKIETSTSTTMTTVVSFNGIIGDISIPFTMEITSSINGEDMIINIPANEDYATQECTFTVKDGTLYAKVGLKRYSVLLEGNKLATEEATTEENYDDLKKHQILSLMKILDTISYRQSGTGNVGNMTISANNAKTIAKLLTQATGTMFEMGLMTLKTDFDADGYLTSFTFNGDIKADIELDAQTTFTVDGVDVSCEIQINDGQTVTVTKPAGTFTACATLEEFGNNILPEILGITSEAQQ